MQYSAEAAEALIAGTMEQGSNQRRSEAFTYAAGLGPCSLRLLRRLDRAGELGPSLSEAAQVPDIVLGLVHDQLHEQPELMDEFTSHFQPMLRQLAKRVVNGRQLLRMSESDLVQELLFKFWRAGPEFRFRSRTEFRAWASKSLANLLRDRDRMLFTAKRREDLRVQGQCQDDSVPASLRSQLSRMAAEDELRHVFLLLKRVPDHERVLFERHFQGEQVPELAEELGIPASTAYKRIRGVRAWLARRLLALN